MVSFPPTRPTKLTFWALALVLTSCALEEESEISPQPTQTEAPSPPTTGEPTPTPPPGTSPSPEPTPTSPPYPDCRQVSGDEGGVEIALERGSSLIENRKDIKAISYTWDVEVLPDGRTVWESFWGTLFRSKDSGCTFVGVENVPSGEFKEITVDPLEPNRLFLTSYDSPLLQRTGDGGQGWSRVLLEGDGVRAFAVDPRGPGRLRYVTGDNRLFLSDDDGKTWTARDITFPPGSLSSVNVAAFHPTQPDIVLVGSAFDGLFRSTDAGLHWEQINEGIYLEGHGPENQNLVSVSVAISQADPQVWFAALNYVDVGRELFRSVNSGDHWQLLVTEDMASMTGGTHVYPDPVDPDRFYFWFGTYYDGYGTDLYETQVVSQVALITVHHYDFPDLYSLAFHPLDPTILYLGRVNDAPSDMR